MKYILVVDEGTSSVRAVLFDENGGTVHMERQTMNLLYPSPGLAECDANEMWANTKKVMQAVVKNSGVAVADILSVGMTAQRESAIIWEKDTGKPIYNCILWQDRRTDAYCKSIARNPLNLLNLHMKTGLIITSFFPAVKIAWMLDNIPGARQRAERGELCFGTVDTWLFYNMTGRKRFVAEQSNAARTQLYNIEKLIWDDSMLKLFNIPKCMLAPEVLPSDAYFGDVVDVFDKPIPIYGSLGDQQAATFGQQCFSPGEGKISLGTGGAMSLNIGDRPTNSLKLLSTIGWNVKGKVTYHYETGFYFCGGILDWLKRLGFIATAEESSAVAQSVADTAGVKLVNCFFGLSVPVMIDNARGIISGLTPTVEKAHIVRAALESIGYQTRDSCALMEHELKKVKGNVKFKSLAVDGGVSNNTFVMQFIADILNMEVYRHNSAEATSLGAFYISGIACGLFSGIENIKNATKNISSYKPAMDKDTRRSLYNGWKNTLNNAIIWGKNTGKAYVSDDGNFLK